MNSTENQGWAFFFKQSHGENKLYIDEMVSVLYKPNTRRWVFYGASWLNYKKNSDGQQFHQHQHDEQSILTSFYSLNIRKTMTYMNKESVNLIMIFVNFLRKISEN